MGPKRSASRGRSKSPAARGRSTAAAGGGRGRSKSPGGPSVPDIDSILAYANNNSPLPPPAPPRAGRDTFFVNGTPYNRMNRTPSTPATPAAPAAPPAPAPVASPFKTYLIDPAAAGLRPFVAYPVASVVLLSLLLAAGGASVYYKIHSDWCGLGATVLACLLVGVPSFDEKLLISPPVLGAVAVLGGVSVACYPTWALGPMTWLFLGQVLLGCVVVRLGLRYLYTLCVAVVFIALLIGAYYLNNLRKVAEKSGPYDQYAYVVSLLWGLVAAYSKRR